MQKSNFVKFPATLFIICFVASGLLGVVYSNTKDKIQAQNDQTKSLKVVLPQAQDFRFVERGENSYYVGKVSDGTIAGYVFDAKKKGYASDIVTLVGITEEGIITEIKILSHNETPGLGSKISEVTQEGTIWTVLLKDSQPQGEAEAKPWFQKRFEGHDARSLEDVDTITGATISSKAVIDSIQQKAEKIMGEINNGR